MRKFTIPVLVLVCLTTLIGIAAAVRPSGPGQSTKANSLSVAVASDQTVPVSIATAAPVSVATKVTAVTPGSTDITSSCTDGVLVGQQGDGGLLVAPAANSD